MNIKSSVFRAVNGIFQFAGGLRGLDRLATRGPVQPTVDLARLAQIGAGLGNFWGFNNQSMVNDHTGAVVVESTQDPYSAAIMGTLQTTESECWAWLINASMRLGPNLALTSGTIAYRQTPISGALTSHLVPLARFNVEQHETVPSGDDFGNWDDGDVQMVQRPFLIAPGGQFEFRSVVGAMQPESCIGQLMLWYGPRGVLPPGLA